MRGFKFFNGLEGVFGVFPAHALGSPQGGLADVFVGRGGGDAAQPDFLDAERIGRAEDRPHVVQAADVVEHHHDGGLGGLFEGLHVEAVQFLVAELAHGQKDCGKGTNLSPVSGRPGRLPSYPKISTAFDGARRIAYFRSSTNFELPWEPKARKKPR